MFYRYTIHATAESNAFPLNNRGTPTVLPAKGGSDFMFSLISYMCSDLSICVSSSGSRRISGQVNV